MKGPEELNHRRSLEVEVVAQKSIQQVNPVAGRGDRYRANRREPAMRIPDAMYRGLPTGCIGAPDDRFKHEARFIHKDKVSPLAVAVSRMRGNDSRTHLAIAASFRSL